MNSLLSAPLNVTFSLTPRCNLSCRHCFAAKKAQNASRQMGLQEWKQVVDQLYENQVFRVLLSGGEPLVLEYFQELCEYILFRNINCSLNTNAILVDKGMAWWMKKLPFRGRISVSLDGASRETHEYMRGKGTFENTIAGIRNMVEAGLKVRLFFVATQKNWKDIPEFVKLAQSLGCYQAYINEFYPVGRGFDNADELSFGKDDFQSAMELCLSLLGGPYKDFINGTFVENAKLYQALQKRKGTVCSDGCSFCGCGNGNSSLVVNFDGTTAPCEMLLEADCGDILADGLAKIWGESEVLHRFRKIADVHVSRLKGCELCPINDICDGGCRAIPYMRGELLGESICCLRNIMEK